jgi:hypothetical protein
MCQFLFCKIMQDVCANDFYFLQKSNAHGIIGFSCIKKCTKHNDNVGLWLGCQHI